MAIFSYKNVNYHISTWGDIENPPLVLLHGFAQSASTWEPVAQKLAQHRYVIAPDFIGHGKSDKPADPQFYEMSAIHNWLTAIIDELCFGCTDLLGYSMGGRIALTYAIKLPHKINSLILESAGTGPATDKQHLAMVRRDQELVERLNTTSLENFMDFWEELPVFESQKNLSPEIRKSLRRARMNNDAFALALTVEGTGQHMMRDYSQDIRALPMPILYIAGVLDARYFAIMEKIQDSEGITGVLLNAGHNTHLEAPEAFGCQVNAFLRDLPPLNKRLSY